MAARTLLLKRTLYPNKFAKVAFISRHDGRESQRVAE